jgi:uncharacterized Zn-binding protein involved in type VI secretion
MLKRYSIRLGAKTTAGGVVKTASSNATLNGVLLAVDGDLIDCPACASEGVIHCVRPRISDTYNGKELALSDDLCICRCSPSPKLIADQDVDFQFLVFAEVESAEEAAARRQSANTADSMPMRFIDQATGKPQANCPYRLELKEGSVLAGTTDAAGWTRPLTKEERDALVAWNVTPAAKVA